MKADNELSISSPQNHHHHHHHQPSVESLPGKLPVSIFEKEENNKHQHQQRYSLYDKWSKQDKSKTSKTIFEQEEEDQFKTKHSNNINQKQFVEQEEKDKLTGEIKKPSLSVTNDIKKDTTISTSTTSTGIGEEGVSSPINAKTNLTGKSELCC